jgi:Fe2+ transport system protein FeoA
MESSTFPNVQSLSAGDVRTVASVRRGGPAVKRLADMGFVRGARLEMIRPGEPCIVQLDGSRVALGSGFQASIELSDAASR